MAGRFALPSVNVADARDQFPTYLDRARRHVLQIVTRRERDEVALVALADLQRLLRHHRFETEVSIHPGEAIVALTQFAIIGIGATLDEAIQDALEKLRDYALQYLQRFDFYQHTDREELYPLVVRFLATPQERQHELLLEPQEAEAAPVGA